MLTVKQLLKINPNPDRKLPQSSTRTLTVKEVKTEGTDATKQRHKSKVTTLSSVLTGKN